MIRPIVIPNFILYSFVMDIIKSREDKRIEFLLGRYLKAISDGQPDNIGRLLVSWEFKLGGARLFERLSLGNKDVDEQTAAINEFFKPTLDMSNYDIIKLVAFFISMEYPVNEKLNIERIRSGTDRLTLLNAKVTKIHKKMSGK